MIKTLIARALLSTLAVLMSSQTYAQTFVVTEVKNDEIHLVTFTGHEYVYYDDVEDWLAGDIASAVMDSKGTEVITDDEILSLKYSGYIDSFE